MAELTVQTIPEVTGLNSPVYSAVAAGGDSFPNDDRTIVHLKNTNAATRDVTFTPVKSSVKAPGHGDITLNSYVITLAATTGDAMVALPPAIFNASGRVTMTYESEVGVTVAIIRRPKD